MTKDNQDALLYAAECIRQSEEGNYERSLFRNSGEHLRRLVAENEAKDALLRQAVEAFFPWDCEESNHTQQYAALAAIRQHLEGRA